MRYQVGQRIRIIPHCEGECGRAHCAHMNGNMHNRIGQEAEITGIYGNSYRITGDDPTTWAWSECMVVAIGEVRAEPGTDPVGNRENETKCDQCGAWINTAEATSTEDNYHYCSDCVDGRVIVCADCDTTWSAHSNYRSYGDSLLCEDCYSNNYFTCQSCEDVVHTDNAYSCESCDESMCESCYSSHDCSDEEEQEPYEARHASHAFYNGTIAGKWITFPRHIGVEIEAEQGNARSASEQVPPPCGFTHDGSLDSTGVEVQTPPASLNNAERIITEACKGLTDNNFKATARCGLHVHVDAKQVRTKGILNVFKTMYAIEDVLYSMLPPSRWNNRYCIPLRKQYSFYEMYGSLTAQALEEAWYKEKDKRTRDSRKRAKYDESRYSGLNIHSYYYTKTLEFRMHSGTINPEKICQWVQILLSVVDFATMRYYEPSVLKLLAMPMSKEKVKRVIKLLRLTGDVARYMEARIYIHNRNYKPVIGEPKFYACSIEEHKKQLRHEYLRGLLDRANQHGVESLTPEEREAIHI